MKDVFFICVCNCFITWFIARWRQKAPPDWCCAQGIGDLARPRPPKRRQGRIGTQRCGERLPLKTAAAASGKSIHFLRSSCQHFLSCSVSTQQVSRSLQHQRWLRRWVGSLVALIIYRTWLDLTLVHDVIRLQHQHSQVSLKFSRSFLDCLKKFCWFLWWSSCMIWFHHKARSARQLVEWCTTMFTTCVNE